jgi:hypothetical protein
VSTGSRSERSRASAIWRRNGEGWRRPSICADGQIVVSELVLALHSALYGEASTNCTAADMNDDGLVDVGELVAPVGAALRGCGRRPALYLEGP